MEGIKYPLLLALVVATALTTASTMELTLDEAIRLVLQNNRTLIEARLTRDTQKFSLEVAEDEYRPKLSIDAFANTDDDGQETADLSPQVNFDIPSGGQFTVKWSKPLISEDDRSGRWTLGFSQPLLKGFGSEVDTASLRTARINEQMNILALRDTVADVVESVIHTYRSVIRANQSVRISQDSLQRAKEQLAINHLLIQAGSMARNEIIQTEAEVADRELDLVESRNGLVEANSDLIDLLDMEHILQVEPSGLPTVKKVELDLNQSIETALLNRHDHLQTLYALETAKINLLVAEDGLLWDLTLDANMIRDSSMLEGDTDYSLGLQLNIPLWRQPLKFSVLKARNALRQAEMDLAESRQKVQIEVRQAVHDVEIGFRQTELAKRARELAEQKLGIEKEKLAEGLSSTFRLTSIEDDLVRAQNAELNASLSYLRALTEFDRVLGTALDRWGIVVEPLESL